MKSMHCKLGTLEAGMDTKVVKSGIKRKRKSVPSQEPLTIRLTGTFISLELRIFFDGAKLVTGAEVVQATITQEQTGIPGIEGKASRDSTHSGSSNHDALWLSGFSHSVPPDRKKVESINPAAEGLHLDSIQGGNFVASFDLELKVPLLETKSINTGAEFQKWQRLFTETTYIAYEPASLDLGDQAHEIHSTKLWGPPNSCDGFGRIYRVDRIGLVLSSNFSSGSS